MLSLGGPGCTYSEAKSSEDFSPSIWITAALIPGMPERDREKVEWACHGMPFLQSTVVPAEISRKGKEGSRTGSGGLLGS